MAMGRRKAERQEVLFVPAEDLPRSAGHPFYQALNRLLAGAGFDTWVEELCRPHYAQAERRGQPSIPPGVYFRMLLVGYFEGIDSQRGIAWRCADSLSIREFLGLPLDRRSPDHSSLTNIRKRLPEEVFEKVFQFVLKLAHDRSLISGKAVGVDSTTLEANAAMKSIVRRGTGEDWRAYVVRLMKEEGVVEPDANPGDDEVRRYDRNRKDKKVSNEDWVSETDPGAKIARMKDGRTHMAYKAEHVVDLESDLILAAEVHAADRSDSETLLESLQEAQVNLIHSCEGLEIEEVAADKGYHSAEALSGCDDHGIRTYIPEPRRKHNLKWDDKPEGQRRVVENNRRRTRRAKGKALQKLRSERCERSFAHLCETGGMRRSWLRGLSDVSKRYQIAAAAHNLGRILLKLTGTGKPRTIRVGRGEFSPLKWAIRWADRLFGPWWPAFTPRAHLMWRAA